MRIFSLNHKMKQNYLSAVITAPLTLPNENNFKDNKNKCRLKTRR